LERAVDYALSYGSQKITEYQQKMSQEEEQQVPVQQDYTGFEGEQQVQARKKNASCYIDDVSIKDLKKSTVEDIKQFFPSCKKSDNLVRLNAVVDELVHKVDQKNWTSAKRNVKQQHKKTDKLKKEVLDRKDKYILILNDQIIDGHHFLAKAYLGGVTNSIKVLDITPLRFQ
jgi:hypothetical protein